MISNLNKDDKVIMSKILDDIKPYVIVVGSVAEKTNNSESDIDFYVKTKPEKVIDKEIEQNNFSVDGIEETYIDSIIEILRKHEVEWESEFVSYITTKNLPIQLEFSPIFDIKGKRKSKVDVYGVELESYISKINDN